jgi:hypothetical protein
MNTKITCPVCKKTGTSAEVNPQGKDISIVHCVICGVYEISRSEEIVLSHQSENPKLAFSLRKRFDNGEKNIVHTTNSEKIIKSVDFPETITQKSEEVVRFLYNNKQYTSSGFILAGKNKYIFGIVNDNELELVITMLEDQGLIGLNGKKFATGGGNYNLSGAGIQLAEKSLVPDKKLYEKSEADEKAEFLAVATLLGSVGIVALGQSIFKKYKNDTEELNEYRKIKTQIKKRIGVVQSFADINQVKEKDEIAYNIVLDIFQLYSNGFNRASVVFCGALIEYLLRKQNYKGSFSKMITKATEDKLITKKDEAKLNLIRLERNDYAHDLEHKITEDETLIAIQLSIKMLDKIIC